VFCETPFYFLSIIAPLGKKGDEWVVKPVVVPVLFSRKFGDQADHRPPTEKKYLYFWPET